jgi:hypothetical protein
MQLQWRLALAPQCSLHPTTTLFELPYRRPIGGVLRFGHERRTARQSSKFLDPPGPDTCIQPNRQFSNGTGPLMGRSRKNPGYGCCGRTVALGREPQYCLLSNVRLPDRVEVVAELSQRLDVPIDGRRRRRMHKYAQEHSQSPCRHTGPMDCSRCHGTIKCRQISIQGIDERAQAAAYCNPRRAFRRHCGTASGMIVWHRSG